ncbi:MAG: FtsB family cell division protein [Candidatus Brocadia sp.]
MQDVNVEARGCNNHHAHSPGLLALPPGKTENGNSSGEYSYWGKFVLMVSITSCVVILFSSIISKTRQERIQMLETKKVLEKQEARLVAENSQLENEYSALKNDPVRIEKEARELLGYIGTDEIFYERYNFRIRSTSKKEPVKIVPQNKWKTFLFDGPFPWQFPALIILIAAAYYLISYHYEYRKLRRPNC